VRRPQFGVGISTGLNWVRRFRATGSVTPSKMSGQKRKPIPGEHRTWLLRRIKDRDFRLRGLVAELAKRRSVTVEVTKDFVWNSAIGPQTAQRCARDGRSPFG